MDEERMDWIRRHQWISLTGIIFITALPFLNKPYHIDDTFVLRVVQSILQNPLDPFLGEIDWFGHLQPVWEATTNPPFLSYYLAPFAGVSDYSEIVLHLAMLPFLFLMGGGILFLTNRFAQGSWIPILFTMTSCAVIVSGDVMRDVPAAGLATASVALFIAGTDREKRSWLFLGAILAGLATLTKYSSVITIPILMMYPFLKQKYRLMFWVWPTFLILVLWCLHNQLMYGAIHIVYLFFERRSVPGNPWQDKLCGALVVIGSILYLLPVFLRDGIKWKDWWVPLGSVIIAVLTYWGVRSFLHEKADIQYHFWAITGAVLLYLCLYEGFRRGLPYLRSFRDEEVGDSLFLLGWLGASVFFSIFLVPFQAVRHLITALPPLTLLVSRYMQREPRPDVRAQRTWLTVLLAIQTFMSFWIQFADYEYAAVYRDFAAHAKQKWVSPQYQTWFVGQWGWMFYAERAGFRQIHRDDKEFPKEGDILLWPKLVHIGDVFVGHQDFVKRLQLVEDLEYPGRIPMRTMNFRGASFYAVISLSVLELSNIPYRFFQKLELERGQVYRVGPPIPQQPSEKEHS